METAGALRHRLEYSGRLMYAGDKNKKTFIVYLNVVRGRLFLVTRSLSSLVPELPSLSPALPPTSITAAPTSQTFQFGPRWYIIEFVRADTSDVKK